MIAEKIRAAMEEVNYRNTRPRRLIAEHLIFFAQQGKHFTIDDFWYELRQQEPGLGRATVYRSIEALVEKGMIDRIDFADGSHRYRVCSETAHQHLTCTGCRHVVEVTIALPEEQIREIGSEKNFSIEGFSFTLFGRCADCRAQTLR